MELSVIYLCLVFYHFCFETFLKTRDSSLFLSLYETLIEPLTGHGSLLGRASECRAKAVSHAVELWVKMHLCRNVATSQLQVTGIIRKFLFPDRILFLKLLDYVWVLIAGLRFVFINP